MTGPAPRADGLRLLRLVVFGNSLAIVAVVGLLVLGLGMIQASRADSIRRACVEQNERHDRTLRTLDALLTARAEGVSRARLERLKESRASTVLLIEALAPRDDCEKRVDRLTR
jgi:hypothetical protein